MPKFHGSLRNSFSYKGFSVHVNLLFKFGHYFLNNSINYQSFLRDNRVHKDVINRWRNPGDEKLTDVPAVIIPFNSSREIFYSLTERNIQPAGFIRLQDLNLSIPLSKFFKVNGQLFFSMNNLGIIWRANRFNVDPENLEMPRSKTYALGMNFNLHKL